MNIDPRIDKRLWNDLDAAEDDKLTAYLDTAVPPNWTAGRGHKMPAPMPGQSWEGFTITQDVSDRYFNGDILSAITYAKTLPEWKAMDTPCRQNALVEICFNMRGHWNGFVVTRAAMQSTPPDWQAVHAGLLNSAWAKEVQPHEWNAMGVCKVCGQVESHSAPNDYCQGRDGRATRLARYFLTGQYE